MSHIIWRIYKLCYYISGIWQADSICYIADLYYANGNYWDVKAFGLWYYANLLLIFGRIFFCWMCCSRISLSLCITTTIAPQTGCFYFFCSPLPEQAAKLRSHVYTLNAISDREQNIWLYWELCCASYLDS